MSDAELLEAVEVVPAEAVTHSVIWLHGLGADGHDFEPIVPQLRLPESIRFVFPHAPVQPVTLNQGYPMRSWFDIIALDRDAELDIEGTEASRRKVEALIRRENDRGVPTDRIILAGFSQGGALALHTGLNYPERLAGIVGLSTFLHTAESLAQGGAEANRDTPIFMAHGSEDPLVAPALGEQTRDRLQQLGHSVEWHMYPMQHGVCMDEIQDLSRWLAGRL